MDTASLSKFIVPAAIFLLTLASGLWLSRTGKPLNAAIFNVHKLIALGAVVVTILQIIKVTKVTGTQSLFILLAVFAGLCVLALFISGAMMSAGKLNYDLMLTIHKIAPIIVILLMAGILYLLTGKTS